ncbi:MAG: hypothetical protein WB870_16025 [Gallionellaceae bacterium]
MPFEGAVSGTPRRTIGGAKRIATSLRIHPLCGVAEHQGENEMAKIEQKELEGHRSESIADVKKLVERYCAIFDWDVPDINQGSADKLILVEMRNALDDIERELFA